MPVQRYAVRQYETRFGSEPRWYIRDRQQRIDLPGVYLDPADALDDCEALNASARPARDAGRR